MSDESAYDRPTSERPQDDGTADLASRVAAVRRRIVEAAARAGRDPSAVRLVAATKTVTVEQIERVLAAGVEDVGENRAQELLAKAPTVAARWHFLGPLQRNKVKALAPWVTLWHSIDRPALGPALARVAPGARVLVEVNLAAEPQKPGCAPMSVPALVDSLRDCGLEVAGLMAVPPAAEEPRRWFARLAEQGRELGLVELSMGMTHDFEIAVEEGATMVRVGRALFGPRSA